MPKRKYVSDYTVGKKKSRKAKKAPHVPRILPSQRGYLRTGGAYGRFGGGTGEPELKVHDVLITQRGDGTTPSEVFGVSTFDGLLHIAQGTDDNQRIGRKIVIKSLQARLAIKGEPSEAFGIGVSPEYGLTTYLYLVQDTQANGALAAVTDVFTSLIPHEAMINIDNSMRFRILKKWIFDMEAKAGVTGSRNDTSRHVEWYKKCDIPVEYSGTAGSITELRSNNLFFVMGFTDTAQGFWTSAIGTFRVRYADN